MKEKIYIIGVGRVGSAFSYELKDKGYNISYLTDRNSEQLEKISIDVKPVSSSTSIEMRFAEQSDIILICVQDRYIADVIKIVAGLKIDSGEKCFIHTSGAESSEIFSKSKFTKNNVASLHPIQTFDKMSYENNNLLKGIYFGIEGGDKARDFCMGLIDRLNSKYLQIPKDKKYLYHSACVVSSNFIITLLNISSEIIGSIGLDKSRTFEIFKPIIEKTLNNISNDGLINSLTGPFERNDVETISKHLNSLNKELPSLIPFYTLLGMETVKVAFKKESLNLKNVISILDLMNEYISNEYKTTKKTIH